MRQKTFSWKIQLLAEAPVVSRGPLLCKIRIRSYRLGAMVLFSIG